MTRKLASFPSLAALAVVALVALGALAAVLRAGADAPHTARQHGLTGWVPRKIADEKRARQEIETMLEDMHRGYREGDLQVVAAHMDFPVQMVTDDWKGEVIENQWDRDTWTARMSPMFQNPVHDLQRTHSHNIFIVSDSLANVDDEQTVNMGKTKVAIRSSSLVVRRDRRWFVKSVVEGGWGDSQLVKPEQATGPQSPAAAGTGGAQ